MKRIGTNDTGILKAGASRPLRQAAGARRHLLDSARRHRLAHDPQGPAALSTKNVEVTFREL